MAGERFVTVELNPERVTATRGVADPNFPDGAQVLIPSDITDAVRYVLNVWATTSTLLNDLQGSGEVVSRITENNTVIYQKNQ